MTDPNTLKLIEDPAPTDALGPIGTPMEEGQTIDPTTAPEHDDSPEALNALLEAEAQADISTEATLPTVTWARDLDQPDYGHSHTPQVADLGVTSEFELTADVLDLLIRANHFKPRGTNGLVAFGLRGGQLLGGDIQEGQTSVKVKDTRPDHAAFQCTLGIYDTTARTLRAYTGSTVPNKDWMRNYYKKKHGIQPHKSTDTNLLPTGCYIYRVNSHRGDSIKPALRMTNPDNLSADAECTVLRTHHDLSYSNDDFWDNTTPYDNIHCAYSNGSFSSAGCQTIKGKNHEGAWGAFQAVIGALGWNARIDYILLTGREAAIAAAIIRTGRADDAALVDATLGRLRVGSEGDAVTRLQRKLGFRGSAYFGPLTKERLVATENAKGLPSDGIYSPSDDLTTGWSVFETAVPTPEASLQLSGEPTGNVIVDEISAGSSVSFQSTDGASRMQLSTTATLDVAGASVPLAISAQIDGIPAGVAITLQVTAMTAHAAPAVTPDMQLFAEPAPALLTDATFDAFAPRAKPGYRDAILANGDAVLGPLGIDATPLRLVHFLAQIGHESGGFTHSVESLNYSTAARIHAVWPSRFRTVADAEPFVHNEQALANTVYSGRLGNTAPDDGFRYRGRGLIQLTGKANYQEFADRLSVDLVGTPDLAFDPLTALRIAASYWANRKLRGERTINDLADDDKLRAITYRINGGFTNFADRESELAKAKSIWQVTDAAPIQSQIVDRGDFSDGVRRLQLSLVTLGLLNGTVDGKFGHRTYEALFGFKTRAGLPGAGYADKATFDALSAAETSESVAVEGVSAIPNIANEPEPIRNGISLHPGDAAS